MSFRWVTRSSTASPGEVTEFRFGCFQKPDAGSDRAFRVKADIPVLRRLVRCSTLSSAAPPVHLAGRKSTSLALAWPRPNAEVALGSLTGILHVSELVNEARMRPRLRLKLGDALPVASRAWNDRQLEVRPGTLGQAPIRFEGRAGPSSTLSTFRAVRRVNGNTAPHLAIRMQHHRDLEGYVLITVPGRYSLRVTRAGRSPRAL